MKKEIELEETLRKKKEIEIQKKYYVSVPANNSHIGHNCGEQAGMAQRIHPTV